MSPILGTLAAQFSGKAFGAFDSIASATPSGPNTVTFSSIPQTFTHLQLRVMARMTTSNSGIGIFQVHLNSNSSNVYYLNFITAVGNDINATNSWGDSTAMWGLIYGTGTPYADTFAVTVMDLVDYSSTNKRKTIRASMGGSNNENDSNSELRLANWTYQSSDAIDTITLTTTSGTFASGTIASLYGIKGS